jgi:hypothetical protein
MGEAGFMELANTKVLYLTQVFSESSDTLGKEWGGVFPSGFRGFIFRRIDAKSYPAVRLCPICQKCEPSDFAWGTVAAAPAFAGYGTKDCTLGLRIDRDD